MSANFTVDIVALLDRLGKVEQECKDLRQFVGKKHNEALEAVEEVKELVFDYAPKLKDDNTLIFETGDSEGNTVYGHVTAEVRAEQ